MAFIECKFRSEALELCTAVNVILPDRVRGVSKSGDKVPVLWLLHGYSDDHTIWCRRTSIERYVEGRNLAVIMPAVDHSFYTDMAHGNRYWTYISDELPALMRYWFPLSAKGEDNFVAGLSMGGYGAFKLALSHPNRYAAAASLSGALRRFSDDLADPNADPQWIAKLSDIFGDLTKFPGSRHDVYELAEKVARGNGPKPRLYACCGAQDFLYADNLRFKAHAGAIGLPLTYEEGPGDHTWAFWDQYIQRVLAWMA
jgi:putative tributyrin esterase